MAIDDLFALVDCVPTPIFVLDVRAGADPVYAHYNKAARLRLNRPLSDFVGRTSAEVFGSDYGQSAVDEQRRTIAEGKLRRYEFELPIGDELRIVRTTLFPQRDAAGRVFRLIGSAEDVSVEWIAQKAQQQLQEFGSEVEQFVNMAAHDLRAPMRNVMMLTEMLREDFVDQGDGKLHLIDMLGETADKSMALISDVLEHAMALKPQGQLALFDVADIVEDIRDILDPQRLHHFSCTSLALTGEKPIFQIVLRNLFENAIKHGQRDRMHIRCTVIPASGDFVEMRVEDDGSGFDNPGKLFLQTGEFRVDSGYGLLGIQRLIKARGGTISAQNLPENGGGLIRLTLPAQVLSAREGAQPLKRAAASPHARAS
ncbi:PAS domain-containing sensor histidine kinase [Sulfitobacter albidus]|uniref:histidine kinase n=1 Tax=Sulfitobacter albidus TaxID=2829501 RepID=A0A975JG27_9RHOB|nr:PAS domain-containing sensor histidine kinase [Sulfitobacter albidus]QUJ77881.1 PAS domain-containing sensor histidine kinase [Sulfitobacter albidus]